MSLSLVSLGNNNLPSLASNLTKTKVLKSWGPAPRWSQELSSEAAPSPLSPLAPATTGWEAPQHPNL